MESPLLDNFEAIQQDEMETILSDGTGQNLYKTIEDVMYGLYLHADKHRIQNLIKIDPMLIFIATRKYELNQIGIKIDMYRQEYRFTPAFAFIQAV